MRRFRCLYLIPGIREPQVLTLVQEEGTLPLLQALVGGLIEYVSLTPVYDLWVNEEGLMLNLTRNRA